MKDKTEDGNYTLIPRTQSERRKAAASPRPAKDSWKTGGRFEVLPTKAVSDNYSKRARAALDALAPKGNGPPPAPASGAVTADNYQKAYLNQQRQTQQQIATAPPVTAGTDAAKAYAEKKTADDFRFRAREIQNQIAWWRQQRGMGQYDDTTIGSMVDTLQREWAGIPEGYR